MSPEAYAQTLRLFEGLGKPLSTREIEILAQKEGMIEVLRCKDCKMMQRAHKQKVRRCWSPKVSLIRRLVARAGQYAGKCFVYKDK